MDLNKYLFINELTSDQLASESGFAVGTISRIRNRAATPNLMTAMMINLVTEGQVTFEDMMSLEDLLYYAKQCEQHEEKEKSEKIKILFSELSPTFKRQLNEIAQQWHKGETK